MESNPAVPVRGFFGRIVYTVKRFVHLVWLLMQYGFDRGVEALARDVFIIQREADIFLGSVLLVVGLLGFESGRYCDGNVGDYISCTRPATYYYFDTLDVVLICLGAFFILVWYFKSQERAKPAKK